MNQNRAKVLRTYSQTVMPGSKKSNLYKQIKNLYKAVSHKEKNRLYKIAKNKLPLPAYCRVKAVSKQIILDWSELNMPKRDVSSKQIYNRKKQRKGNK